jgi:hypothetical protein
VRWPWKERDSVRADVEEARQRRIAAEELLEKEQVETVRPLRQMYRENHIGPLLDSLVQRRIERGIRDAGPDTR